MRSGSRPTGGRALTDRLLTAAEVAERLAVPVSWVYAETRAGRLPHVRLGRYYRYASESINAFVAGLEQGPTPYRKYHVSSDAPESGPARANARAMAKEG